MAQIYAISAKLVTLSRNVPIPEYAGLTKHSFITTFLNRWQQLDGNQRAFIATMLAMRKPGGETSAMYNTVFHMKPEWFMSKATYQKVRKQLIDGHVLAKFPGSRYRYVLNPDYHPNLTTTVARDISNALALEWFRDYSSRQSSDGTSTSTSSQPSP